MYSHSSGANLTNPPFEKTAIEQILSLPFTNDNHVKLLDSGEETFQAILDAVSGARNIICIEFYIFKDDTTGRRIAALLKEKARQGVNVYLLYDHFGSFLTTRAFWSDLKKSGIHVRVYNPFRWSAPRGYLYRNHKKLLLIDGKTAITGGFNIADEYHGYFKKRTEIWRDMGIYLEGPIAATMLHLFRKNWKTWKGEMTTMDIKNVLPVKGGVPVIPIFASNGRARRKLRRLIIFSIKNAKKDIYLTTAYFIPDRRILKAMLQASKRGVTFKLLLPGKSDLTAVLYAGRKHFSKLLNAGVEIYTYQGAILHSKTAVFDDTWSIIGSTNLDHQSLRRNEESNVGILDSDFNSHMKDVFNGDLKESVRVNAEEWAKRPLYQKFLEYFYSLIMKKL